MSKRIPSYRHYKARNLACVDLDGRRHYLGRYGSPESRREYDRLIAEWLANDRTFEPEVECDARDEITIVDVMAAYMAHCESYYGPISDKNSETYNLRPAMRTLRDLYGDEPVKDFGPLRLKAVRQNFVDAGQEVDWNADGLFDQLDIIAALLQTGTCFQVPAAVDAAMEG